MKDAHFEPLGPGEPTTVKAREAAVPGAPSVRASSHGGHTMGDVLAGKYRIVGFLGEGGMGTVWRARSLLLDVDVAIKVLHREHADGDASARLLREARATASLRHPAIVRVFDFGETDAGAPFLVMELLEGISLADWIDGNGRMPAAEAVRTLLPIADALVLAHAQGVVHRDVKPDNILLVSDGTGSYLPKILDFGIAKLLTNQTGRVLTQAGAVLGSLEYMSPEQAEGRVEVGEQTDVWGLSVVLYELMTGRRPFAGTTLTAILFSLLTRHPTPTTQLAAGDEELWDILARGLRKSPTERWPDMRAFGSALAFWAVERGIVTDATGTSLTHRWLTPPSETPDAAAVETVIAAAPTAIAPTRAALSVPARLGTTETTYVTAAVPPPTRRTRAVLFASLGALALASLVAAGKYTVRGEGASSLAALEPVPATGSGARPMVEDASPALPLTAVPEPAPAPSAVESASLPAPSPIKRHPATAPGWSKRASPAMPLPAAPNF